MNAYNFTASDVVGPLTDHAIKYFSKDNEYYKGDDWSIDESDRNYTEGYTMLDGCYMKDTRILDGGKLVGVNWDAVDDVKSELYLGHGMITSVYFSNEAFNYSNWTLYECRSTSTNHMVQLVGWDDDYPAENFTWIEGDIVHTPEDNGAWLCKNSWGSQTYGYDINGEQYYVNWGVKDENGKATGFFWVSYYDWSVSNMESLTFTDRLANEDGLIYLCYDYLPESLIFTNKDDDPLRTSNVFYTYYGDIDAVSIRTFGYDSDVTVKMYLVPKDSPDSGRLVYEGNLTIPYAGIHVLYLDEHIPVKDGHRVSVVVEEGTSDGKYVYGASAMWGEEKAKSIGNTDYGVGIINEGESYVFSDGEWKDWSAEAGKIKELYPGLELDNFSIKVFEVTKMHEETNHFYNGVLIAIIVLAMISILFLHRRA